MRYATLGRTGLYVSRIALGAMTFAGEAAHTPIASVTTAEADRIVGTALDAGVNLIDTADVYGQGASESVLGAVLGPRRDAVVLATKGHSRTGPGVNDVGQSRRHLTAAIEASLRRLRTDWIDLYQLHNLDPVTPIDETLRALDDAVRVGKLRHVGCCNLAGWQLTKALAIADHRGWSRFASLQAYYALVGRDIEREVLPAARDGEVGLLCWSPLAGGLLSGKFDRGGTAQAATGRRAQVAFPPVDPARAFDAIDVLRDIAQARGSTVAGVALAWLLARPGVTSVVCGATRPEQIRDNVAAVELVLTDEEQARLEEVSRLPAAYPGWIHAYRAEQRHPPGHASATRADLG